MFMKLLFRVVPVAICFSIVLFAGCSGDDAPTAFDCATSDLDLQLSDSDNPTDCATNNGSITVTASGGTAPYTYALNLGAYGSSSSFNSLGSGDYTVRVKDKNGCIVTVDASLQLPGENALTANIETASDTECFDNNGTITVIASGGQAPYQYKFGSQAYGDATVFNDLAPGNYSVSVKDALNCVFVKSVTVSKGDSQTSLRNHIQPIININCAISNCHNGSEAPNLTTLQGIRDNGANIKTQTQNGNMPKEGSLTAEEKALIACWVDEGRKDN
jgi:hypothetical protein